MKLTLSVIKADIGSIGAHIQPSEDLLDAVTTDTVRNEVSTRAIAMRRQGFFGAAMLPMSELEYTGITDTLASLDGRFRVRDGAALKAVAGA